MADLYDVTDADGEFWFLDVEGHARAVELAEHVATMQGRPAFVRIAVEPDEEGSEALYAASDDAEEVQPLPAPPSEGD